MQKKLLSILLVLCMLLGMFPMALPAAAEETVVEGNENTEVVTASAEVVEIGTAEELFALMGDSTKWAGSYKLTADIDLSTLPEDSKQNPIGNNTTAFTGTFDGDGKTISGINISGTTQFTGLFGVVSDDGDQTVIKNLTILGSVTSTSNFSGALVGLICGDTLIDGVTVGNADGGMTFAGAGTGRLGGIAGGIVHNGSLPAMDAVRNSGSYDVTIRNCTNYVDITNTASSQRFAGIVGSISAATTGYGALDILITGCVNYGDITSSKDSGGIVGRWEPGDIEGATNTVTNCKNYGTIISTGTNAGGIIAIVSARATTATNNTVTITSCENHGAVTGTQNVGGISGHITSGKATGATTTISDCKNYEKINGTGVDNNSYAGGIVGYTQHSGTVAGTGIVIEKCYNEGEIAGITRMGGILGYANGGAAGALTTVETCWNAGYVNTSAKTPYCGGIVGVARCIIKNCYNTGEIKDTVQTTGITPYWALSINDFAYNYSVGIRGFNAPASGGSATTTANYYSGYTGTNEDKYAASIPTENVGVASVFVDLNTENKWIFTDNGPELAYFHDHDLDAKFVAVEDGHVTACYCNDASTFGTEVVEHVMVEGVCEDCGYIACAHANTEERVSLEPTCTDVGYYNVFCNDCQSVVSQGNIIDIDPEAHATNTTHIVNDYDNSGAVLYVRDCCGTVAYEDYDFFTDIYVSTAGSDLSDLEDAVGDGEENAFLNFEDAMIYAAASATVNGEATIHIVDKGIVSTSNYKTPAYDGLITVTGGELHFNAGTRRWFANGDVKFEHLTITTNSTAGMRMFAQNHYFEMGEGIVMGNAEESAIAGYPSVNSVKMYIQGGFENGVHEMNTNLVIRSGSYWYIGGWNQVTEGKEASSLCSGTGKITIGKTDPDDTLFTKYLVGYTTGAQQLSAASKVTILIDGEFGAQFLVPGTQNDISANKTMLYETDIVLKEGANFNAVATETIGVIDLTGTLTTQNTKVTVYVDHRSEDAIADAAIFTTDNCFENMGTVYSEKTYVDYCATYLNHDDADEDGFCDECDANLVCDHVNTEKVGITAGTCTVAGTYNIHCSDCGQYLYDEPQTETEVDYTNHVDAEGKTDATWVANENGTFDLVCNLCGTNAVEGAEQAYVYFDPSFKHQMTTSDDALGISEDSAVRTLVEAVERLKTVGGKIIFVSALEVTSAGIRTLPAWEKEITFTHGGHSTGLRIKDHGAVIEFNGPTKIERFIINCGNTEAQNSSDGGYYNIPVFVANWNDFTVGTNVQAYGACYFVIGNVVTSANVENYTNVDLGTTDENGETVQKTVKVVLNRTIASAVSASDPAQPAVATFDRVYLGTRNRTATPITVKNVHIDFESVGATFNLVFAGSVSEGNQAFMENCSIKAVFGGNDAEGDPCDAYIKHFQVGQGNTNGTIGTAYLDKLELELNGSAYMQKVGEDHKDTAIVKTKGFSTRNVRDLSIKISTGAERVYQYQANDGTTKTAEKYNGVPFYISASTAYAPTGEEKVTITYGSHSFADGVAYPTFNKMYTNENGAPVVTVTDECTWGEWKLTTEATPDKAGVETRECSVCGRKQTKEVKYVCTAHAYVARADGTYYCANSDKCEDIQAPVADAVIALTPAFIEDGAATVNVVINAASIWGTKFTVNAPAGFTLADVSSTLGTVTEGANSFIFEGADEVGLPYSMAVLNLAVENVALENAVVATLTFTVDETVEEGTYIVTVTADEAYTVDEAAVNTAVVAAEVAVPVYAGETCQHENTTTTSTATCTEGGVETTVCDDCGETVSEVAVEALGHDMQLTEAEVKATFTAPGKTAVYTCANNCGKTEGGVEIPQLIAKAYVGETPYETVQAAVEAAGVLGTVTVAEGVTETVTPTAPFYFEGDLSGITIAGDYEMDTTGRYKRENGEIVTDTKIEFVSQGGVKNIVRPALKDANKITDSTISHSTTLQLESAIIMGYKVNPTKATPYAMFYAILDLYTADEKTVDADSEDTQARRLVITDKTMVDENSRIFYSFEGIPAMCINNKMTITYVGIKADGTVDYKTYESGTREYLTKQYASATGSFKTLLEAIFNYVACAQLNFAYNTENLMSANIANEDDVKTTLGSYDFLTLDPKLGTTIELDASKNEVAIFTGCSFAFEVEDRVTPLLRPNHNGADVSVFAKDTTAVLSYTNMYGEEVNLTVEIADCPLQTGTGKPEVRFTGIAAADLRQQMSFTIYQNYGTENQVRVLKTYVRSLPEKYASDVQSSTAYKEELKTLTKSMINYSEAACTYFKEVNNIK